MVGAPEFFVKGLGCVCMEKAMGREVMRRPGFFRFLISRTADT